MDARCHQNCSSAIVVIATELVIHICQKFNDRSLADSRLDATACCTGQYLFKYPLEVALRRIVVEPSQQCNVCISTYCIWTWNDDPSRRRTHSLSTQKIIAFWGKFIQRTLIYLYLPKYISTTMDDRVSLPTNDGDNDEDSMDEVAGESKKWFDDCEDCIIRCILPIWRVRCNEIWRLSML